MHTDSDNTSSDDDENLKKLLASTDREFMNDTLYKKQQATTSESTHNGTATPTLPSLRKSKDEDESYNFFRVTPGFREYVAKSLDKRLEKGVKYTKSGQCTSDNTKRNSDCVKLFRDSSEFLSTEEHLFESTKDFNKSRKRERLMKASDVTSSMDECEKVKSAAVSPEDVLSHKGTEHWCFKNKIFKYKKQKDGTLESIDDP